MRSETIIIKTSNAHKIITNIVCMHRSFHLTAMASAYVSIWFRLKTLKALKILKITRLLSPTVGRMHLLCLNASW